MSKEGYTSKIEEILWAVKESGLYHVDHLGRVWTCRIPKMHKQVYEDRWVLVETIIGQSYFGFKWKNNNVFNHILVHWWKVGPIPLGYEVDHLNNNSFDNHPLNLEAVTISENQLRRWARRPELRDNHRAIFANRQFSEENIKNMYAAQQRREVKFLLEVSPEELEARREKMKSMNIIANNRLSSDEMTLKMTKMREAYKPTSSELTERANKGWDTRRKNRL